MSISISYILPFYKKAEMFKVTFPMNAHYLEEDAEVICVLDEPTEEREVLKLVRSLPNVKFVVIVNDDEHEWRTPSIAYNVGIQHARGTHCALTDPECIIQMPSPDYLRRLIRQDFRRTRAGIGWHIPEVEPNETPDMLRRRMLTVEAAYAPAYWGFGFLLAHRCELAQICGFDESRTQYGGDDDDIRIRLTRLGVITEIDPLIKIFHILHPNPFDRVDQKEPLKPRIVLIEQQETWGHAFGRIAYDWKTINEQTTNNSV